VLEYQADLDAQVAKEMAWREDDQEYIRRRDALFARNLQVQCQEFTGTMPGICRYKARNLQVQCLELRFALPPLKELSHEFGSGHAVLMDSTWQGHVTLRFMKTVQIQIRVYFPFRNSYFVAYRKLQNFLA